MDSFVRGPVQDDSLHAFSCARPLSIGLACRMLGSEAESEDLVQDVWMQWQPTNRDCVHDGTANLPRSRRAWR